MVISKSDLIPYVPFSADAATQDARLIQPDIVTIQTSAVHDNGIYEWCRFLEEAREAMLSRLALGFPEHAPATQETTL